MKNSYLFSYQRMKKMKKFKASDSFSHNIYCGKHIFDDINLLNDNPSDILAGEQIIVEYRDHFFIGEIVSVTGYHAVLKLKTGDEVCYCFRKQK